ncbi:MAG TPA: hypothetical protein VNP72_10305 [Longimicrobium sp.]|nr:hypothetical protein [Longimicrobium sp.]
MIDRNKATEIGISQLMKEHDPITEALDRARISTVLRHRQMGVPLAVVRDGRVCLISADEVRLPGEEAAAD